MPSLPAMSSPDTASSAVAVVPSVRSSRSSLASSLGGSVHCELGVPASPSGLPDLSAPVSTSIDHGRQRDSLRDPRMRTICPLSRQLIYKAPELFLSLEMLSPCEPCPTGGLGSPNILSVITADASPAATPAAMAGVYHSSQVATPASPSQPLTTTPPYSPSLPQHHILIPQHADEALGCRVLLASSGGDILQTRVITGPRAGVRISWGMSVYLYDDNGSAQAHIALLSAIHHFEQGYVVFNATAKDGPGGSL